MSALPRLRRSRDSQIAQCIKQNALGVARMGRQSKRINPD